LGVNKRFHAYRPIIADKGDTKVSKFGGTD